MRRSVLSAARKATAQSQVRKLTYDECAQERSKILYLNESYDK